MENYKSVLVFLVGRRMISGVAGAGENIFRREEGGGEKVLSNFKGRQEELWKRRGCWGLRRPNAAVLLLIAPFYTLHHPDTHTNTRFLSLHLCIYIPLFLSLLLVVVLKSQGPFCRLRFSPLFLLSPSLSSS